MTAATPTHSLDPYARIVIRIGVNLQPGQRLALNAPIEAAPLVRKLVKHAYQAGSPLVDVSYSDEQLTRVRLEHAPDGSLTEVAGYRTKGLLELIDGGGALLSIAGSDPDLLKGQDAERVATAMRAAQQDRYPISQKVMAESVNWSVVAMPVPSWAAKVFPDDTPDEGVAKLWQAIFRTTRADAPDPVAAWEAHIATLGQTREHLNSRCYSALHFLAPGTDLMVGLPERHRWVGGELTSQRGIRFVPNLPTEEVFTLPHRERTEGTVTSSKPLAYAGQLIEDFTLTFKAGQVVEASAKKGEAALHKLLATDEGARRLGEVALVTHNSPVAQTGLLFYNTLFDENAASHLALGRAYRFCLQDDTHLSDDDAVAAGANDSLAHVDFMIGSAAMDVDGVTADGTREAVMRQGAWAFL